MSKKPLSLRINLIKSLVPPLAATGILIALIAVLSIFHEVDEVYDATLVQFSKTLAHMVSEVDPTTQKIDNRVGLKNSPLAHRYERKVAFRILRDGKLITESADAINLADVFPVAGFSDQLVKGKKWRFFKLEDKDSGLTVEVAERYNIRQELTFGLLTSLIGPAIVFMILALGIIWWGTTHGLQRLVLISSQVDRRAVDDLSPITDTTIPVEIQPLLDALNRLFARIEQSFSREREFTDNAAHELRTPLAAMKTQAQVLLKTEALSPAGVAGFNNLLASIDRAVNMTENLLSFARLQSDKGEKNIVDLSSLVRDEVGILDKASPQKKITLHLAEDALIEGMPQALSILVRNIIQNAVKFTPDGGDIVIDVQKNADTIVLSVRDSGMGVADEYKQKIFERFFRINKSLQTGSGLGLAMVKWVADTHQARIKLSDNMPQGLIFTVAFKAL